MTRHKTFVIVGAIVSLLAGILNSQTAVEIHAASATAVSGWRQMAAPSGAALWVAPETRLTSADIARAEAIATPDAGPGVGIVLTDAGAAKMDALARERLDQPIAMLLDGKVIWAPIVRGAGGREVRLTGGPGGLTQQQIARLLDSFKAR
jgi:preprotein translocase subunit SecD